MFLAVTYDEETIYILRAWGQIVKKKKEYQFCRAQNNVNITFRVQTFSPLEKTKSWHLLWLKKRGKKSMLYHRGKGTRGWGLGSKKIQNTNILRDLYILNIFSKVEQVKRCFLHYPLICTIRCRLQYCSKPRLCSPHPAHHLLPCPRHHVVLMNCSILISTHLKILVFCFMYIYIYTLCAKRA